MAAAVLFGAASCAKEDISSSIANGEQVEVTFTANLPELGTRAYGDGLTATNLQYYVYEKRSDGRLVELSDLCEKKGQAISGSTTVRLALIKGMTYVITFWADNNNAPYTFDGQTVSIDYTTNPVKANNEELDAFYGTKEFKPSVDTDTEVKLRRPFAQLNAATDDLTAVANSGIDLSTLTSQVTVKNVYSTLNLIDGTVDNPTQVTFDAAVIPANKDPKEVLKDGYDYLSMNYVLVNDKNLVEAELIVYGKTSAMELTKTTYTNVPLQRNYRTNILGSLITKSTDFNVEIVPDFIGTEVVDVFSGAMHEAINITKNGYYIFDNLNLTVNNGAAVNIAAADVVISLAGNVYIESANGSGIAVAEGAALTLKGGHITAKGNGNHAFGIGGNGATVTLDGVTVDYACGGHIQPLFVNDTKYGKSEPEGGPAIGGAVVNILNSTITKVDGGSKAAAIGAQYWQSAEINIENSTIVEANGGNASAGIGGSRYNSDSKYNLEINIVNSNVTATGGQYGAGIGSGYDTHCDQQNYTATNKINIDATSVVDATGGKYAAGIGTGFHSAYLSGAIEAGATITATSGEKVYKDTYTTAQNIGYGVVDPAREFSGNNANVTFTVAGQVIEHPHPAANIGNNSYGSFEAAVAAAQAGDTVTLLSDVTLTSELTLPAGITLNGNGKQINGTLNAGGNVTFAGHTKVTAFSAGYYNRTITIGEGACLEVTGTGRVSFAYGNTFDITGNVSNAKTADKSNIQPSLIIPGGISITGGNDATMNITNAYVKIGSTSSKNSAANGVFTLNIENSIAEFTNQLTFSEPTNGKTPTFNINIKNSVLTTATKLILAAPKCNMVVDNSTINIATYFRNSGKVELKNDSVLTGSTIQFGENGGHNGETTVDNSTFTITTTHPYEGLGTGVINVVNGATVVVDYYKAMTINVDTTSTFTGTEVL